MSGAFTVLADVLGQMSDVVRQLGDTEYRAPGPAGVSGSVGQHVRHCLDHVLALEHALRTGYIDYDVRARGGAVETNRSVALRTLDDARQRLLQLDEHWLSMAVAVRSQLSDDGRSMVTTSTAGRELAFVISHTIHHSATVSVLLQQQRHILPARFGFAASTPCALSA